MAMKQEKNSTEKLWGIFNLEEYKIKELTIGDCSLSIKKNSHELHIHTNYNNSIYKNENDNQWSRYLIKENFNSIKIMPELPDKDIIVKTDFPFWLTKNANSLIFFKIPLWISICIEGKNPIKVIDIPSVVLSDTWFGDLDNGHICYFISTSAKANANLDELKPHLALSSLNIENKSDENLLIEKLCIEVENSTLFLENEKLFTDHMNVSYSEQHAKVNVIFKKKPYETFKNAKKITEPRKNIKNKSMFLMPSNHLNELNIFNIFSKH